MDTRGNLSRITVDITKEQHRRLKAKAAILGKSMREVVIEAIEAYEECLLDHSPNKETVKTLKNIKARKNLVEVASVAELLKKMGL